MEVSGGRLMGDGREMNNERGGGGVVGWAESRTKKGADWKEWVGRDGCGGGDE